ncbi:hypothetical protein GTP81_14000 [Rugamonas sp. FT107W]|uniref:Uncharacterized protein n=1 Tax=Duganella vulcania TaxID=2692166 RepID=A0A845HGR6_9BURK|nr:hypothetical protein [Duganella vulcania]MYN17868.1 hypothetical protein [Duganella vulcania]
MSKSMTSVVKFLESDLELKFKDIGKYLDFFDKSIESEQETASKRASRHDDKMIQSIMRYQSHISFPAIHSTALLIFMHSSFEHLFCWSACWFAFPEDGGSHIPSLTGYKESEEFIRRVLGVKPFESSEWKSVNALRQLRNYIAHGGSENIMGVKQTSRYLHAARKINREYGEAFDIKESCGTFAIKPKQSSPRIAMACYRSFLLLLIRLAKEIEKTPKAAVSAASRRRKSVTS